MERDGARCDAIRGELSHISLSEMPGRAPKGSLLAVSRGLTLKRQDVGELIAAGECRRVVATICN